MPKHEQLVRVGGHRIRLSNLEKVLYPATGTTKGDVIGYYRAIAETMLPHCADRPATRKRWPDGVGEDGTGFSFFQKDLGEDAPEWVATGSIEHRDHVNDYPLVNDPATLVWLGQLAALELHVPQWRFGPDGVAMNPDRLVFDLDPGEGVPLADCARVAFLVRDILRDMGLTSVPVTSGSKGIHLYAALDGEQTSDQVSAVARELARSLEADHPDEITSSMKRALRPGKVFIDWSQNNGSKTTVAPYSLRGRTEPLVAAPRTWRELASPHLRHLDFREVLSRVKRRGDPLEALLDAAPARDRLQLYRSKRDAARTPEPVPEPGDGDDPDAAGDLRFVIQRHEARRLHYDFRLEHDGVLVSWALPKGVPTDPSTNHLAVPTEDHPLSYRHFAGRIPKGEYGAGTVEIWDAGTYELEEWSRDKVVAALTGRPGGGLGGTRRYALFRAGELGGKPSWLIHLMPDEGSGGMGSRGAGSRGASSGRRSSARAGSRRASSAADLSPMLAETGTPARLVRLDPEHWAFEMKWDGIRAIASIASSGVELRSRSGADLTTAYPELASLHEAVNAEEAVLDGEIVALGDGGAPSFSRLQTRFGLTDPREIARARRGAPAALFVFDVLRVDGRDCRGLTYLQRRELLERLIEEGSAAPVSRPEAFDSDPEEALETSRRLGLEGIVAKRRESLYHSGARSGDWLKFPLVIASEAVVVGWRDGLSDASDIASLLLAVPDGVGRWRYAGRVGTGFSNRERREIRKRFAPLECSDPTVDDVPAEIRRDAHWVVPDRVCEVTAKGRTESGVFRQPVWRGWRPDKSPDELGP
ncbi:ATP-dependent DNA ligase [Leucobacter ruminantium]|uniref:DNA ligase (ATP) n=1 Tax=Leucobacter ruminantium TaxID=1289170 RepID=A0A939LXL5_9MICO|nr:ATP-dependent DNA ligase [Leucobacter ruminantium]MBO1805023.1 ATP-dependent DNA ligase [Leucobacter ruminantium]